MRYAKATSASGQARSLDLLDPNLWNVCEIVILAEDYESMSDGGRRDPDIVQARTAAGGSSVRNDRGEGMSNLRIDGNRLEFALNPGDGAKTPGSGGPVPSEKHAQMQLRQRDDRNR
jgi:hypothetical protein